MLDKSVPYVDFLMVRKKESPIKEIELPEEYKFSFFTAGDERDWAEIETSVLEFDFVEEALKYFQKSFLPYINELEQRCIFIENSQKQKIGTCTAWWRQAKDIRTPWLHWVAIKPKYQGKGLSKPLISKALRVMRNLEGEQDYYLQTQTWSHRAVKVYESFGFHITDEQNVYGFKNDRYHEAIAILENIHNMG